SVKILIKPFLIVSCNAKSANIVPVLSSAATLSLSPLSGSRRTKGSAGPNQRLMKGDPTQRDFAALSEQTVPFRERGRHRGALCDEGEGDVWRLRGHPNAAKPILTTSFRVFIPLATQTPGQE
ncbi:hypothetical protein KUCAC02_010649, partial [Chaenocephalus aceratus]